MVARCVRRHRDMSRASEPRAACVPNSRDAAASQRNTSMSSARAARRIVTACRRGEAHVVVSLQAKLVAIAHGLFPGVTADILALVNRLLPAPSRVTAKPVRGSDTGAPIAPELLTALNDRAAARNNEMHARR
jgi:hypothetical protein